ncbi:MAG: polyprenyl synthetase family protein [Alphaproteobacteria bacterium]
MPILSTSAPNFSKLPAMIQSCAIKPIAQSFFEDLEDYLESDLRDVNLKISSFFSDVPLINQISHHLIQAGGKRIRPILTLLCAQLDQPIQNRKVIDLAASLELIHMATLLHDDVIDQGTHRRHKPCAHTLWGNQATILVGDYLFSRAFQTMVHSDSLPILKSLSQAATAITEGEVLQLTLTGDLTTPDETYFKMIGLKTASLFKAACEIGALLGHGSYSKALGSYGYELGIIFQLVDDLLDYTPHRNQMGKTIGTDLKEKKMTLPLLWLYQQSDYVDKQALEDIMFKEEPSPKDLDTLISLMEIHKIPSKITDYLNHRQTLARSYLQEIPSSPEKTFLEGLLDFCIERVC